MIIAKLSVYGSTVVWVLLRYTEPLWLGVSWMQASVARRAMDQNTSKKQEKRCSFEPRRTAGFIPPPGQIAGRHTLSALLTDFESIKTIEQIKNKPL